MKIATKPLLLVFLLLCSVGNIRAQLSGTITIPNGTYPTLASVVTDLNTQGVGAGGVIINVTAGNPETAPVGGYRLGSTLLNASTSIANTIVINGNANTITSYPGVGSADAMFVISGTDYVSINGLNLVESAANTTPTTIMESGFALVNLNATAPLDGCQFDVIQNCSITLNRTIASVSVGIYMAHVTATNNNVALTNLSVAGDLHNNNKFYGNTISNVVMGIFGSGFTGAPSPYTLFDQNNDVGGTSAATGNTITNCIGTNYTGIGAVIMQGHNNANVSFNTINNTSNGGANAIGGHWGIYVWGPNSTFTVNNNNITLGAASINTTYFEYGIYSNSLASNFTAANNTITLNEVSGSAINNIAIYNPNSFNVNISNNTLVQNQALSATTYGIYTASTGTVVINANNIKQVGTGTPATQFYSILCAGATPSVSVAITNNVFNGTSIANASSSLIALIYSSDPTANKTITGNSISNNLVHNSSGSTFCIYNTASSTIGAGTTTVANNNFSNITKNGTGAFYGMYWIPSLSTTQVFSINNNTFSNISSNAAMQFAGIYYQSGTTDNIFSNNINNITSAGTVFGIYNIGTNVVTSNIYKNKLYNLSTTGAANGVYGITVAGGITSNIYNNILGDFTAPASSSASDVVRGISLLSSVASSSINVYYNTIYLNATSTGANFSTSGIFHATSATATTATLDMRDNIIVNNSTATGSGITAAFRRSSASLANFATTSNNNLFYAGTPGATRVIMYDGTNSYQTLANYQAAVAPADAVSITENPPFASLVGANATYLHFNPGSNTAVESAGANVTGYTDDFDAQVRQGNAGYTGNGTAPDIGADEFQNCNTVTITTQPTAAPICFGANISFTTAATNGNVFQWQVNTGSGFVNVANGGVYAGATTATLVLTAPPLSMSGYTYKCLVGFGGSCAPVATNVVTLTVNPLPDVTVTANGSINFCTGSSVTLSVPLVAGLTYQWRNGTTNISGQTTNSYVATATGNYNVVVTNTSTTCNATSATTSVVVGIGPAAVILPSGTVGICPGSTITLSAGNSAGVTYQWSDASGPIAGATQNTYTTGVAGTYIVKVSTSATCFTISPATTVFINPLPVATATPAASTTICPGTCVTINANTGTGITYQWLQNNAPIIGATNVSYSACVSGSYQVKVTNTATGCGNTSPAVVVTQVAAPNAFTLPSSASTSCDSLILTGTPGAGLTYQWKLGTADINGATNPTYTALATGTYAVVVTNTNNCSATSPSLSVTIRPSPIAMVTYSSPITFCKGGAVVLSSYTNTGVTYQWLMNGDTITNQHGPTFIADTSGNYSIKLVNIYGCIAISPALYVRVNPLPTPVIVRNFDVLSTVTPYILYQWFKDNDPIGGATASTYTVHENGGYSVRVTDINNCQNVSPVVFVNNVGIKTFSNGTHIRVYPNPTHDFINVDAPMIVNLTLRDLQGRTILIAADAQKIDLRGVADGVYMLIITDQQGQTLMVDKLIKSE